MLVHTLLPGALRVLALLAFAMLAMFPLRAASSATRRLVLALALGGALVLPLVSAAMPSWRVAAPEAVSSLRGVLVAEPLVSATPSVAPRLTAVREASASSDAGASRARDLALLVLAVWGGGAALVLGRLVTGLVQAGRLVRRAKPAPAWHGASERARLSARMRRVVEVRMTDDLDAPAVAGALAPVILVPTASSSWTETRRYAVLLHELAHVRQADCLAQVVAQLACAAHWYNPLVWAVARRFRVERELAADDAVLAAGARPSGYAADLLAISAALSARTVPAGALGMAERSMLASRVAAIVSARPSRRPPSRFMTVLLANAVGASVLAFACATPVASGKVPVSVSAAVLAAPVAARPSAGATTIDARLQGIAEDELEHAMDRWRASAGTVLVLAPSTGEILANAGRAHGVAADVAVSSAYVTGSTLKAFTLAAALEEGAVSPTDRFDCEQGVFAYHGVTVHDARPSGVLTLPEMLAVSSNVGFTKVFDRLGGERLGRWLSAFHFGAAPPVDGATQGTLPGRIENDGAGAMLAIGEALTASPLQVAAAYAALANGGVYVPPTLHHRPGAAPREVVVKAETARAVVAMLEGVVSREQATGTRARVEGQTVAGKTGTAEWELPDGSKRFYMSFVGLVPSTSPRFVILVGLEQPEGDESGGTVAAPVFSRVATRALAD